jgi:molybdopterin-guanine dinucleotide biosynthesis protein A
MRGALILAGGRSKRMKKEKCEINVFGKTLIQYVVERLSFLDELRIALRRDQRIKEDLRVPLSFDSGMMGPLEGMRSGLREMRSDYIFVTACDMPMIRRDAVEKLFSLSRGYDAVIPKWSSGYLEPLHGIYRKDAMLIASEDALKNGERRISSAILRLSKVLYFPAEDLPKETFFNVNSEEDLRKLVKFLIVENHGRIE